MLQYLPIVIILVISIWNLKSTFSSANRTCKAYCLAHSGCSLASQNPPQSGLLPHPLWRYPHLSSTFIVSLLQSVDATRTVLWIRIRFYDSSPAFSISRFLLPLLWVYFVPFHVPFGDILKSQSWPSNALFTLTELRVNSCLGLLSFSILCTWPSHLRFFWTSIVISS